MLYGKKKKFICVTNLFTFEPWPLKIAALCNVKKKYMHKIKITGKTEMLIPVDCYMENSCQNELAANKMSLCKQRCRLTNVRFAIIRVVNIKIMAVDTLN